MTQSQNQYFGVCYVRTEDGVKITDIFPVDADWRGYEFSGYCIPSEEELVTFGYRLTEDGQWVFTEEIGSSSGSTSEELAEKIRKLLS